MSIIFAVKRTWLEQTLAGLRAGVEALQVEVSALLGELRAAILDSKGPPELLVSARQLEENLASNLAGCEGTLDTFRAIDGALSGVVVEHADGAKVCITNDDLAWIGRMRETGRTNQSEIRQNRTYIRDLIKELGLPAKPAEIDVDYSGANGKRRGRPS